MKRHPFVYEPKPGTLSVTNLSQAYEAYWSANTFREEQAAYHEILLFGGHDGYAAGGNKLRSAAAWAARRFAHWIEEKG